MSRTFPPPRQRAAAPAAIEMGDLDRDTEFLQLRKVYVGHLERGELGRAVLAARRMAAVGILVDIAHHDEARAYAARGEHSKAIAAQDRAVRTAPRDRKSFQLWSLATLQQFADEPTDAMASLARAIRFADRDRPLVRAHLAWVRLEKGLAVPGLSRIIGDLHRSPSREGYGRFLLGMIAHEVGDARLAASHLRAFLKRNAQLDRAKELTLREELRRARRALAQSID